MRKVAEVWGLGHAHKPEARAGLVAALFSSVPDLKWFSCLLVSFKDGLIFLAELLPSFPLASTRETEMPSSEAGGETEREIPFRRVCASVGLFEVDSGLDVLLSFGMGEVE